jgi:hypothetical protein
VPGARLAVVETVIEPGNAPSFGKMLDLEMLVQVSGKERTEEEFRTLFLDAGFKLVSVTRTESPMSVIEAVRVD